jgi:hypothetical protein
MQKIVSIQHASEVRQHPPGTFLRWSNILFRRADASKQVLVFFNGGVPASKLKKFPMFQRWSWHEDYSGTLAFVADPDVHSKTGLSINWYAGRWDEPRLPSIFDMLGEMIVAAHGTMLPITTFGSSAGGYAAIMSVLAGFADHALAINPQTDVRRYYSFAYKKFLQRYNKGEAPQASDLARLSILAAVDETVAKTHQKIRILQNIDDTFHYQNHYLPLVRHLGQKRGESPNPFQFEIMSDDTLKHSPPGRQATLEWIRRSLPEATFTD